MNTFIYKHETPLFVISLIISIVFWLILLVGTFGAVLIYVLFFFIIYLFAHSGLIAYIKGTAVKLTPGQFPDLYQRMQTCCETLGIYPIPDSYVLHAEGAFNAFATRFLGRNFVVLFSDVVDALESRPDSINFYIGHELGHIQRKHLIWGPILFPAGILPLIGAAYHRARELTCDNFGAACCPDPECAINGLAALAAGQKRWKQMNTAEYLSQVNQTGGFWMSFHELISDYPWLVKRMFRVATRSQVPAPRLPSRNPLAYFFALFVPRTGAGGGGAGAMIGIIAVVAILAAIALPMYANFRQRALEAGIYSELERVVEAEQVFHSTYGRYTDDVDELDYFSTAPGVEIHIAEVDEDCFQAYGTAEGTQQMIWVDCTGQFSPPPSF